MRKNAFVYVDNGATHIRIEIGRRIIDQQINSPADLNSAVSKHGLDLLWLSSSMDFPEEYGWTRPESPRQFLNI